MLLPMFILLPMSVFITQLIFCLYAKKLWIKLLLIVVTGALDILCWLIYFSGIFSDVYGGDFAAFIYGILLLMVVAIAGAAWGIYGIVRLVQRR